jgi:hypothetical protein
VTHVKRRIASAGPTTPWWASDNGTDLSTRYGGTGAKAPLTVSAPAMTTFTTQRED